MKKLCVFLVLLFVSNMMLAQEAEEPKSFSHKGFYNSTNFGLLIGSTNNQSKAPFSFMMINGYGITDQFALGFGIGSEFLNESYLPLVLDTRYYLRQEKLSPFVFVQGGYAFPMDKEVEGYYLAYSSYYSSSSFWPGYNILNPNGGWMINPGVGIKAMFGQSLGMTFTIAYRFQRLTYDRQEPDPDRVLEVEMNRLEVKVGIFFK